jgi:hypothetical protein
MFFTTLCSLSLNLSASSHHRQIAIDFILFICFHLIARNLPKFAFRAES